MSHQTEFPIVLQSGRGAQEVDPYCWLNKPWEHGVAAIAPDAATKLPTGASIASMQVFAPAVGLNVPEDKTER